MKKLYKTLFFFIIVVLQGCAYRTAPHISTIKEVPRECLDCSCKFLGQVVGDSVYSFLDIGMQIAKDKAKNQAYKLGATHVVWEDLRSGGKPVATARAYRCKKRSCNNRY